MIEVILNKSFISDFGDINLELGRLIDKILLNENNIFIINSSLMEYIENNISDNVRYKWESYFTYLSDNSKLNTSANNTLDTNAIFAETPKQFDYVVVLKSEDGATYDNNSCNLKSDSINDIFFRDLLEKNQITLRHFNFDSNSAIKLFFKKLFNCSKTNHRIILISRYNNFNCDLIEVLKNRFTQKTYWTTYKGNSDPSTNITYLKSQLGNSLFLYTGNNEQIHERKFILGNLIVEFDDDFNKITTDVDTWTCNCSIDKQLATNLRLKQNNLRRVNQEYKNK
jgi:hypothetical protein